MDEGSFVDRSQSDVVLKGSADATLNSFIPLCVPQPYVGDLAHLALSCQNTEVTSEVFALLSNLCFDKPPAPEEDSESVGTENGTGHLLTIQRR